MSFTIRKLNKSANKGLDLLLSTPLINTKQKAVETALSLAIDNINDKETIKKLYRELQEKEIRLLIVKKKMLEIEKETEKEFLTLNIKKRGAIY